ncbi:hypothetical protein IPC1225_11580 [Pseudomonas aeruginosa]|nr:hypothetical protein IPC1225_11580 [Pseudomonas aeruginosa]
MPSPARTLLLAFVSAWFLLGGLGHFVFTDFFVGIVPPYVPWPLAAVWVSGVFELLGAGALLVPAWRRLARRWHDARRRRKKATVRGWTVAGNARRWRSNRTWRG